MKGPDLNKDYSFASSTLRRHFSKGLVGFGSISVGFWMFENGHLLVAIPFAIVGMVALRGCPMCWTIGLVQLLSQGKLRKKCVDGVCRIEKNDQAGSEPSTLAA